MADPELTREFNQYTTISGIVGIDGFFLHLAEINQFLDLPRDQYSSVNATESKHFVLIYMAEARWFDVTKVTDTDHISLLTWV